MMSSRYILLYFFLLVLAVFVLIIAHRSLQVSKKVIHTQDAPAAIGPYSQAVKVGRMLYLSGQIPLEPKTGQINGSSIEAQTKQVLENLKAILIANKMSMNHVISTTIYLSNLDDFEKMNAVYSGYFDKKQPPARVTVQVSRLPRGAGIEIAAIASR